MTRFAHILIAGKLGVVVACINIWGIVCRLLLKLFIVRLIYVVTFHACPVLRSRAIAISQVLVLLTT